MGARSLIGCTTNPRMASLNLHAIVCDLHIVPIDNRFLLDLVVANVWSQVIQVLGQLNHILQKQVKSCPPLRQAVMN